MARAGTFLGPRGFAQADFVLSGWQVTVMVLGLLGLLAASFSLGPAKLLLILNCVFTTFFLLATLYRILLMDVALRRRNELRISDDELLEPPGGWPRYVVQVPLYKERHALPHLVKALGQMDYPKDRLDIQLLIEADDRETQEALAKITLVAPFRVVSIPVSHPRTKPKACNVGLAYAEGEFLVIYDAEDRPDPKQLKQAVIAFGRVPDNVACIQAKLSFFNSTRNLMTRCFTLEYAMWFDLCLPGLDRLRAPIPLGGTSNHFRLSVLKSLKGWDEYNVTEDCDLGLRLFTAGWRTRILDSVTWEEACPFVGAWTRQRSRWVKGYVQTYLVHTRDLAGLSGRLGVVNSLHFHLLIGGSVLSQLLGPLYWLLVLVWLFYRPPQVGQFFPGAVFLMGALCLFLGNFMLVYGSALAAWRRGHGRIIHFAPIMVLYWLLGSLAAWRGTLQLLVNPHLWEKTTHHEG